MLVLDCSVADGLMAALGVVLRVVASVELVALVASVALVALVVVAVVAVVVVVVVVAVLGMADEPTGTQSPTQKSCQISPHTPTADTATRGGGDSRPPPKASLPPLPSRYAPMLMAALSAAAPGPSSGLHRCACQEGGAGGIASSAVAAAAADDDAAATVAAWEGAAVVLTTTLGQKKALSKR